VDWTSIERDRYTFGLEWLWLAVAVAVDGIDSGSGSVTVALVTTVPFEWGGLEQN
jgi:hypothetical protein